MWPDWKGEAAAVIASGPSAKKVEVQALRGRIRVIAVKKNVELAPWADVVYGCDAPWWRSVHGLPAFKGLKLAYDPAVCGSEFGIVKVDIPDKQSNRLQFDRVGAVGAAGNSGFQALNLAVQFGANRILLIGFDMHGRCGEHWYGRNNWGFANNPTEDNYRRWRAAFDSAEPDLTEREIEVVNASPLTDLKCFKRGCIAETLDAWDLQ